MLPRGIGARPLTADRISRATECGLRNAPTGKLSSLLETIDYWAAALFLFEQTPRLPEAIVISLPVRE